MIALIIDKNGVISEISIKQDDMTYLCKKCGFKNVINFECRTEWNVKVEGVKYSIKLFAKNNGRANSENKYDFPPPIDNELYFGNCLLVNYENNEFSSLKKEDWLKIYEKLFGGFENLADTLEEDEEEEDELDDIPDDMKTKDGYLKDGFVVDDDCESVDFESELSEEAYEYSDED